MPALDKKLEELSETVKGRLKKQVRHQSMCFLDFLLTIFFAHGIHLAMLTVLQGFKDDQIECELYLNLRYDGTDVAMMTKKSSEEDTYEKVLPLYKHKQILLSLEKNKEIIQAVH